MTAFGAIEISIFDVSNRRVTSADFSSVCHAH
jgi:hypothetical protein